VAVLVGKGPPTKEGSKLLSIAANGRRERGEKAQNLSRQPGAVLF
jgi:hypothetical protein